MLRVGLRDVFGHSGDLEGLRAVAILLVLLYHAHVPGFGGGFVGVDVFFVISGFLITGILVRDLDATGTISLGAFYARRARRLLPAAAVALVVTLLASAVLLAPVGYVIQDAVADVVVVQLNPLTEEAARDLLHLACCKRRDVAEIKTFDRGLTAAFRRS